MTRILLTGMSGAGKSTLTRALAEQGYRAIDLDSDAWSEWVDVADTADPTSPDSPAAPGRDWVWREDRLAALLDAPEPGLLIVSGCAANMSRFLPRFDHVILLTAPEPVLLDRLAAREPGSYGHNPHERERVRALVQAIEPRLRRLATRVVNTSQPVDTVLAEIRQTILAEPGRLL